MLAAARKNQQRDASKLLSYNYDEILRLPHWRLPRHAPSTGTTASDGVQFACPPSQSQSESESAIAIAIAGPWATIKSRD